ncbi:transposase [Elysia marginata]|uniref:Transposase n=1 Tax=Elysia marginata TaxID=1093978 RepID=A0AAV4H6G8_9GAST|nr:transposase [Elysia marginata]
MWRVIKLGGVTRSEERKMASSMDLRLKQRAVIEFLIAEGCSPIEIYSRMKAVYGEMCLDVSTVRRWTRRSREENPSESYLLFMIKPVLGDHCQRQTLSTNLMLIS